MKDVLSTSTADESIRPTARPPSTTPLFDCFDINPGSRVKGMKGAYDVKFDLSWEAGVTVGLVQLPGVVLGCYGIQQAFAAHGCSGKGVRQVCLLLGWIVQR